MKRSIQFAAMLLAVIVLAGCMTSPLPVTVEEVVPTAPGQALTFVTPTNSVTGGAAIRARIDLSQVQLPDLPAVRAQAQTGEFWVLAGMDMAPTNVVPVVPPTNAPPAQPVQ